MAVALLVGIFVALAHGQVSAGGMLVNTDKGMWLTATISVNTPAEPRSTDVRGEASGKPTLKLLPLGDSITWGCGDTCSPGSKDKCDGGYVQGSVHCTS